MSDDDLAASLKAALDKHEGRARLRLAAEAERMSIAPAFALRIVAAHREILERHCPINPLGVFIACAWCSDDVDAGARWHQAWPCPDVLALADIYSDG